MKGKKSIFRVLLCFLVLIFPFTVFSLYNGNPDLPEMPEEGYLISKESWLTLKIGYEGDFVFNRSMLIETNNEVAGHQLNNFQSWLNAGTFTLGFSDRVELYTALGGYKIQISQRLNPDTHVRYNTDYSFGGLAGIRAIVAYWGETKLSVDAKYFLSKPSISSIHENGHSIPSSSASITDTEWQVGAGISHRVSFFVPYIGVTYSQVLVKLNHLSSLSPPLPHAHIKLKNKYSGGFFFGFGLSADRGFSCNIEGRIIDETAASFTADFRF